MNAQLKPNDYRELLIGCGHRREKDIKWPESPETYQNLTTLDVNPDCNPDVVWDLNVLPYPFEDNSFDEIGAFEVLEHCGKQGDYKFFFAQFTEFHRILKPGGYLAGSCPAWDREWAWGDPSHVRVITPSSLRFLEQSFYVAEIGKTSASDFRGIYKVDFNYVSMLEKQAQFYFLLKAKK